MGVGVYVTFPKSFFFSKNGRDLGFSDTKRSDSLELCLSQTGLAKNEK